MRKHARQMENDIDLKLVSFSKLGTGSNHFNQLDNHYILNIIINITLLI